VCSTQGHLDSFSGLAWSPDGARLATGGADPTARLWDPQTGAPLGELAWELGALRCLSWSPDGARLAAGHEDGAVRVWDVLDEA
jgi:WD40 repeat protein